MDQLVNLVAERAGIPPESAKTAVETVLGFLKDKLPEPIASQVTSVIGGGSLPSDPSSLMGNLGNMFGKK
jgi:hypothetical protein